MTIDEILKNKADNPPMEMPSGIKSLIDKVLSYATTTIGGARGQTRAQGDALTNVAQIAGGVYGNQLDADKGVNANLVSMRGQDLSSETNKGQIGIEQGKLDWEKKKNPLLPSGTSLKSITKGVGGEKPASTLSGGNSLTMNWNTLGDPEKKYLQEYGLKF
jgi:hypothetical protein